MEAAQEHIAGLLLIWLAVTLPVIGWLIRLCWLPAFIRV
jgi:hypothetical protein